MSGLNSSHNYILSIQEDKNGSIWIGTFGDGVFCYNPNNEKWKQLSEKDGLSNNSIISIDGQNGHVWLATLGGVTEVELSQNIFEIDQPKFNFFNQKKDINPQRLHAKSEFCFSLFYSLCSRKGVSL